NYWQIAAGDRGRDYSEFFLRHGVATVGGDPHVQIMKGVKCGDVVILKKGTSHLLAAGKVITRGDVHASATDEEKAQYKHWFEDFDGWEQPAFCHVEWHKPSEPIQLSGLRRGTIQRVHSRTVQELAESVILSEPAVPTSPLPEPVPLISNEAFISFLVEQGHRPSDAENLTDTLRRIRLLVDYYHRLKSAESKFAVTEDETRAFLILPFLLGIGW